jgi:hypothetical protein
VLIDVDSAALVRSAHCDCVTEGVERRNYCRRPCGPTRALEVRAQIFAGFDARNSPGSERRAVSGAARLHRLASSSEQRLARHPLAGTHGASLQMCDARSGVNSWSIPPTPLVNLRIVVTCSLS